jgi:FtsP/CotA-like multicopper oxidase with cupredoxin domain
MPVQFERREFLKKLGVSGGVMGAAAVLGPGSVAASDHPGMSAAPVRQEMDWEAMDHHHEEGVKIFLDNIGKEENYWRKPLEYTLDGDVKVFELTCTNIQWETEPGKAFPAYAYNGMIPGPEIRVTEGDRVRVLVTNEMNQSTSVHWHGVDVPNDQDGVPFITQPPIKPGETYTYEFIAANAGSHMYHSHHNSLEQVVGGLLGAFIIEPKSQRDEPVVDHDYTLILNDTFLGFTLNGRSFPYTQPLTAKLGERIRVRFMNEGLMHHPMHLHGMPMRVIAKDGYNLPAPYLCDTLDVAPGNRYDVIIEARAPGIWAFHCHVLSHAETRNGMFGMVTVLVIEA